MRWSMGCGGDPSLWCRTRADAKATKDRALDPSRSAGPVNMRNPAFDGSLRAALSSLMLWEQKDGLVGREETRGDPARCSPRGWHTRRLRWPRRRREFREVLRNEIALVAADEAMSGLAGGSRVSSVVDGDRVALSDLGCTC